MATGNSNPFGNGSGGSAGGKVAGNNFITNPGGSGKSGTSRRFDDQQAAPQKPVSTRSQDSINGDLIPKPQASTTDAGVGSVGNGNKPFKLGA